MPFPHERPDEALRRREALREAAEWFAERQSGALSEARHEAWRAWREASDAHRWAWERIESVGRRFDGLRDEGEGRLAVEAIGQARRQRRGRRRLLGGLAGLMTMALLAGALWQGVPAGKLVQHWRADHRTAMGEVRRIVLEDGTQVWLNTASALNVAFDDGQRRLELVAGEALIVTGRDAARELHVDTRSGRLTPVGTRFGVREEDEGELLTVFEGAVEVRPGGEPGGESGGGPGGEPGGEPRVIVAGQRVAYRADGVSAPEEADIAREAWIDGVLLADGMPLAALIDELGRYHRGRLEVAPEVAELTLLGAFPLHDLPRALGMLETTLPVKVRRVVPGWIRIVPLEG